VGLEVREGGLEERRSEEGEGGIRFGDLCWRQSHPPL
jgi:hypothetical protein